jgi:hypothetical protein
MSKIINDIIAVQTAITGTRLDPVLPDYIHVTENIKLKKHCYLYDISVLLGRKIFCETSNEVIMARKDVQRELQHYIFGEFIDPLQKVRFALYERDFEKAMQLLDNLEGKMFSV